MTDDDDKPLEARVAALEARAGTRRKTAAVEPISLVDLNKRALAAQRERRAGKRDALGVAKTALEKAFATRPGRPEKRDLKPVSGVAAEMTAQATKK